MGVYTSQLCLQGEHSPKCPAKFPNATDCLCPCHEDASRINLTERKRKVLQLVADGKSTNQIAQELGIASHTVIMDISEISRKLRTCDIRRTVEIARRGRLIR